MKSLELRDIQLEQLNMLKELAKFCDKNDITYFICGGTLLGAIRHKGFIPWDDDIDVLFPRPDFEKFKSIVCQKKCKINDLDVISLDFGNMNYPYCKVINKKIRVDDDCIEEDINPFLWIDLFPMDGMSENNKDNIKLYKKVIRLRRLLMTLNANNNYIEKYSSSKIKIIPKKIVRALYKFSDKKKMALKLDKLSRTYDYNKSKYVGGVLWGYGAQERLLKKNLTNVKVDFENIKVNTFGCFDEYLTNLYGDYMTMPPANKRICHSVKAYKVK